jgi:YD repeat-containing protein
MTHYVHPSPQSVTRKLDILPSDPFATREKIVRRIARVFLPVFWLSVLQPAAAGYTIAPPPELNDFDSAAMFASNPTFGLNPWRGALDAASTSDRSSAPAAVDLASVVADSTPYVELSEENRDAEALEKIAELTRLIQSTGAERPSSARLREQLTATGGANTLARAILAAAAPLAGLNSRFAQGLRSAETRLSSVQITSAQSARTETAISEFSAKFTSFQGLINSLRSAEQSGADLTASLFALRDFMALNQGQAGFPALAPEQLRAQLPAVVSAKPLKLFENQLRAWASAQKLQIDNSRVRLRSVDALADETGAAAVPSRDAPATADLGESDEIQLTPLIRAKATALSNDPVKILNFVRNHFDFAPTYGAAQSAEQMFLNRHGNAFDTSSVLIALLRAANIPARYVTGVVELPAATVQNWLGNISTPALALEFMQRGRIPAAAVVSSGVISAIRFEHVWVEAYVDFAPSRGSVNRVGSEWVPMDASLHRYRYTAPLNLSAFNIPTPQQSIDALVASGIAGPEGSRTGMRIDSTELLGERMLQASRTLSTANPDLRLEDFVGKRIREPETRSILEGSTPFRIVSSNILSFAEVPDAYRFFLDVSYYHSAQDFADGTAAFAQRATFARSYRDPLRIDYVGATAADQQALTQYAQQNAASLSAATLQVKPTLWQGTQLRHTGTSARYGTERFATATVIAPDAEVYAPFKPTALPLGTVAEAGLDAGMVSSWLYDDAEKQLPAEAVLLAQMLHMGALLYWLGADAGDDRACRMSGAWCQRLPSVGWFAAVPKISYFFGIPRSARFAGFATDLPLIRIAQVAKTPELGRQAMLDLGLNASFMEGSTWEQLLNLRGGQAASASAILLRANESRVPIYVITPANAAAILPRLRISADALAEISNAINANLEVIVPERELLMASGWRGAGWVARDPQTGAAAYRIAGGTNGALLGLACLAKALLQKTKIFRRLALKYNAMWSRFARLGPAWNRLTAVGGRIIGGVSQVMASNYVFGHALHMVITDAAIEAAGAFCPLDTDEDDCLLNYVPGGRAANAGGGRGAGFKACWRRCGCGGMGAPGGGGGGGRGGGPRGPKPVDPAYGYELWEETDYRGAAGPNPLEFVRTYISDQDGDFSLGQRWRHNYEATLEFSEELGSDGLPLRALVTLGNGDYYQYDHVGFEYIPAPNVPGLLKRDGGWRYIDEDDFVYRFNADGQLKSLTDRTGVAITLTYTNEAFLERATDAYGRFLSFTYNADGRLETMTDAQQREYRYAYTPRGRLAEVTLPDMKTRRYGYDNPRSSKLLTSITDERGVVLGTIHYNLEGLADESSYAGGAGRHRFRYEDGAVTITDALGTERRVEYANINGEFFQTKVSAPCTSCSMGGTAETFYNSNGYPTKKIDFRGNITTFNYNERGLLEGQTEASDF